MNIYIDPSWNQSPGVTDTQIWNAVQLAADKWNRAKDEYGNTTGYYLQVNQGGGAAQADYVITKGSYTDATARSNIMFVPDVITLDSRLNGNNSLVTVDDASGTIAHEFGHLLGIGDANDLNGNSCSSSNSIMMPARYDYRPIITAISQGDVAQVNLNLMNRTQCQESYSVDLGTGQEINVLTAAGFNPPAPVLPQCNASLAYGSCTNCIPPTCTPPYAFNPTFCTCFLWPSNITPILIDTNGSGFQLTDAENGVLFDFYGSGRKVRLAWTAPGSTNGWLVLDRNQNGLIDDGTELFGNLTPQPSSNSPNGFEALAEFDQQAQGGNGDGQIDRNDAAWARLRVWSDTNHDAIAQPEELKTLAEIGIRAMRLKYHEGRRTDVFGNQFRYRGSLIPMRGEEVERVMYDVILVQSTDPEKAPLIVHKRSILSLDNELQE